MSLLLILTGTALCICAIINLSLIKRLEDAEDTARELRFQLIKLGNPKQAVDHKYWTDQAYRESYDKATRDAITKAKESL